NRGFVDFNQQVCALCNTHDILRCPKREYFLAYVQEHVNMRNESQKRWNDPNYDFYTPRLNEYLTFMQAKSTKLHIKRSNGEFLIISALTEEPKEQDGHFAQKNIEQQKEEANFSNQTGVDPISLICIFSSLLSTRLFGSSLALGSIGTPKLSEFAREQSHDG
ncbi:hypothetical protein DVH24_030125, partial [Malus domestica]